MTILFFSWMIGSFFSNIQITDKALRIRTSLDLSSTSIFRTRPLVENSMWMEETILRNMHIGHPEVKFSSWCLFVDS